jgi:hypothetical protein
MPYTSFASFLNESKEGKLMHLTHLEDILLDEGRSGMNFIQKVLDEFHTMLTGSGVSRALNVTTKWDGAPSIVFGPDPMDGRFFVATKSAFNKTPKLMKTHRDITEAYGDSGLGKTLHICLQELAALRPRNVLQGDLLYTAKSVVLREIDDQTLVSFQPNTILYAVDVNSKLGAQIQQSELGLVIHTMYVGNSQDWGSYRAAPVSATAIAQLVRTPRVVVLDSTYDDLSGTVTFTMSEEEEYFVALSHIQSWLKIVPEYVLQAVTLEPFHTLMQQFLNSQVKTATSGRGLDRVNHLVEWLVERRAAEMEKRSTQAGKSVVEQRFNPLIQQVTRNPVAYANWFHLYMAIDRAKLLIVRKLAQVSSVRTFLPTPSGLRVTGPEGFVAVARHGRMVKLVDRLEFSRANFLAPKEWA